MRLYPPAPVMTRIAAQDMQLGGVTVKAGTLIVIPDLRGASPPDPVGAILTGSIPSVSRPSARPGTRAPSSCRSASAPRTCIGMSFAMMEALAILATLVRGARFEWDGVHAPEPVSRVTLRPKGGMPLKVFLRE